MAQAEFKNIEAKHLAGAVGTIVARYTDSENVILGLIVMDEESRAYLIRSPDDTTVGWVLQK